MKIWLVNHYAVPPQYYPLARPSLIAKNLIKMGHEVTIIAASTVHNSDKNLIEGKEKIIKFQDDGIPYVLINCASYQGNGLKRVINILEFAKKLPGVLKTLEKPDALIATSFDPISCYAGIKYAKKRGIKSVAEIADLWPETLVDYGGVKPNNPVVKWLRRIEKKIYKTADRIVFTMEGAYDYIIEQGWEKKVQREKVAYINNGIDLEQFDFNRNSYQINDSDLENESVFKVIYAGAIRKVNGLDSLLDAAKKTKDPHIKYLIWGDGDEKERLIKRVEDEKINNVTFKGKVDKKYIPFITSKADLNIAHNTPSKLFRFGISFNKLFDYLAAGKPVLCDFPSKYNPAIMWKAGIEVDKPSDENIANAICQIANESHDKYYEMCENARKAVLQKYNFSSLTLSLMEVIKSI